MTAFTAEDFAARMTRAARSAEEAGLAGVLVTPGPDLTYLSGYIPMAITERLTMLVVSTARDPALIVPTLERPDAERAPGASTLTLHDWGDGSDPYDAAARLLDANGRYAVSDAAWAMHVLGLQRRLPGSGYVSMTEALPLLRAVKDAEELARMTAAGAAVDAAFTDLLELRFSGRKEIDVAADLAALLLRHGHSRVDFTVVALRTQRREPAPRDRGADDRGRRHGRPRLRRAQGRVQLRHDPHGSRRRADR